MTPPGNPPPVPGTCRTGSGSRGCAGADTTADDEVWSRGLARVVETVEEGCAMTYEN